jgi:DNA-binding Lrp family transcriptional regulator
MEFARLPRFIRSPDIGSFELTSRDREIIRLVHRYGFLTSSQIVALLNDSTQPLLRRLQLLYHHGFLERPRAQLDYYHRGGSHHIVYALGNKGAGLLKRELNLAFHKLDWGQRNRALGRQFLGHSLLVSDIMVKLELACRQNGQVRLVREDELLIPAETRRKRRPFGWNVHVSSRLKLGLVPDRVFALDFHQLPPDRPRPYFFLEADRSTMPVTRQNLSQSSFYRKMLAYEATWTQGIHRSRFGFHRFRVLTVTTSKERVKTMVNACSPLERGQGLFLFIDLDFLSAQDILSLAWHCGRAGTFETLTAAINQN